MFATHPSTPFRQTSHYTPTRPSPLGPRNSNIATPPWTMGSPTRAGSGHPQKPTGAQENAFSPVPFSSFSPHNDSHQTQPQKQPIFGAPAVSTPFNFSPTNNMMSPASPSPSTRATKFSDRYANQVANPMKTSTSLARSKTRKMYMNRVRNERDEGRFEARGEQMMHADYLADKRRWEESMVRDMDVPTGDMEEDDMLPDDDTRAFDEFVFQEEAMEMAMQQSGDQNGCFSDDEYDDIFMTLPEPTLGESQDMDMS
ncbi:uncharacterized protein N7484_006405 [Penicillium longicatenatum]|uniref:uncharacterized protein n=1 Tax=Penicillium longicatenatum TaxID=1561947 RepID=UPI0025472547|nr:uncharacterized protein N7484_006405 [Penicillium longicatenatum]KAJ5643898.1 hypothetical protein N7484_006405 [Penicillium longicatenatum]